MSQKSTDTEMSSLTKKEPIPSWEWNVMLSVWKNGDTSWTNLKVNNVESAISALKVLREPWTGRWKKRILHILRNGVIISQR